MEGSVFAGFNANEQLLVLFGLVAVFWGFIIFFLEISVYRSSREISKCFRQLVLRYRFLKTTIGTFEFSKCKRCGKMICLVDDYVIIEELGGMGYNDQYFVNYHWHKKCKEEFDALYRKLLEEIGYFKGFRRAAY